jgi:thiamine-monophosphate kinase
LLVPIGDDAAVIAPSTTRVMVTTDLMAEGVHFHLAYTSPSALGFKLVSVNVSDIMAMGGMPHYLFLNLALKKDIDEVFFQEFYDGIQQACDLYGLVLSGGDMSCVKNDLFVSATVIGEGEYFVSRRGAKPGDKVYITGAPGESACGLKILQMMDAKGHNQIRAAIGTFAAPSLSSISCMHRTLDWTTAEPLLRRHLMLTARQSSEIARYATAMLDVSDGLCIDLARLCDESGVGAMIRADNIPISQPLVQASAFLDCDPLSFAPAGGEDYELLFTSSTLPETFLTGLAGFPVTCIGEIIDEGRLLIDHEGVSHPLFARGYEHFSEV